MPPCLAIGDVIHQRSAHEVTDEPVGNIGLFALPIVLMVAATAALARGEAITTGPPVQPAQPAGR